MDIKNIKIVKLLESDKCRGNACDVCDCKNESMMFTEVEINGMKTYIQLCQHHAEKFEFQKNCSYMTKITNRNANDMCAEECCSHEPIYGCLIYLHEEHLIEDAVLLRLCDKHIKVLNK